MSVAPNLTHCPSPDGALLKLSYKLKKKNCEAVLLNEKLFFPASLLRLFCNVSCIRKAYNAY